MSSAQLLQHLSVRPFRGGLAAGSPSRPRLFPRYPRQRAHQTTDTPTVPNRTHLPMVRRAIHTALNMQRTYAIRWDVTDHTDHYRCRDRSPIPVFLCLWAVGAIFYNSVGIKSGTILSRREKRQWGRSLPEKWQQLLQHRRFDGIGVKLLAVEQFPQQGTQCDHL